MATYTEYPPKGYRVRMSTYWWLDRWAYLRFTLREVSMYSSRGSSSKH